MAELRINNPAARLHEVLSKLLLKQKDNGKQAFGVFAEIFGVENPGLNQSQVLRQLGLLLQLPQQAADAITAIPDRNAELRLTWRPKVVAAFSQLNLVGPLQAFLGPLDSTTMAVLAIAADDLSSVAAEPVADRKELHRLLDDVRKLIDDVQGSEAADYLKAHILHHLLIIQQAIIDYRFMGVRALQNALEQSIGAAGLERATFRESEKTSIGRRFLEFIGAYVLLCTAFITTAQLPESYRKLLPPEALRDDDPNVMSSGGDGGNATRMLSDDRQSK